MPQPAPRAAAAPFAPAVFGCGVVFLAAAGGLVGSRLTPGLGAASPAPARTVPRLPGARGAAVTALAMTVRPGETLTGAVLRTGVAADEARDAVSLLGRALDVAHIRAGLAFKAAVARPQGGRGPARLVRLSMTTGPASAVALHRAPNGAMVMQEMQAPTREETHVASGVIHGSFYESAVAAGATPALVRDAVKLFSKTLDFARDIHAGDGFRLVFDRTATAKGATVDAGDLLYAEVQVDGKTRRFYRFAHDGQVEYRDEIGHEQKALLLKTPLDGAHVTSAFGMRLHPLLGYTRMHPGIDFGAPTGTPVYAAGDGVVEEARWAGGYGHWLKLRHADGWETGYGHLSRYAPGVKPGLHVVQGQVVAYVGSTGLSTGPHLHYEIMRGGKKLNPLTASAPTGAAVSPGEVAAFDAAKRRIDAVLAAAPADSFQPTALRPARWIEPAALQ